MKKRPKAIQIYDHKWYVLEDYVEVCCDCGLAHDTQYKIRGGRIWWNTKRNEKVTAQERKEFGITVKRKKENPA